MDGVEDDLHRCGRSCILVDWRCWYWFEHGATGLFGDRGSLGLIGHSFYPKAALKASLFALMLRGAITPKCGLLSRDYTHARAGPRACLAIEAHKPPGHSLHYLTPSGTTQTLPSNYPHQTRRAWQAAQIITLGCWGMIRCIFTALPCA